MNSTNTRTYRSALKTKTPNEWLAIIKIRIKSITMQRWVASCICYYHPDKPVKGDPIVSFSEKIGSITYKGKDLEKAYNEIQLPYFKSPADDSSPPEMKNRNSHNKLTQYQKLRTPGALKVVKFNEQEMEATG